MWQKFYPNVMDEQWKIEYWFVWQAVGDIRPRELLVILTYVFTNVMHLFLVFNSFSHLTLNFWSCLVIGDEILKGQVKDTNSHFASKLLYEHGIKVQKVITCLLDLLWDSVLILFVLSFYSNRVFLHRFPSYQTASKISWSKSRIFQKNIVTFLHPVV